MSVSTTLSTNSILEGTGFPVAMILIGNYDIRQELPTRHFIQVRGGHDHNGVETNSLDLDSIREFAMEVKNKVQLLQYPHISASETMTMNLWPRNLS